MYTPRKKDKLPYCNSKLTISVDNHTSIDWRHYKKMVNMDKIYILTIFFEDFLSSYGNNIILFSNIAANVCNFILMSTTGNLLHHKHKLPKVHGFFPANHSHNMCNEMKVFMLWLYNIVHEIYVVVMFAFNFKQVTELKWFFRNDMVFWIISYRE